METKYKRKWWEFPLKFLDIAVMLTCTYFGLKYAYHHDMLAKTLWGFLPTVTILLIILIKDKISNRWG